MVLMITSACLNLFSSALSLVMVSVRTDFILATSIATNAVNLLGHASLIASCVVLATARKADPQPTHRW